ncbi:MAG: hypothetical protein JXB19_06985 [Bacteroidales bacterium]|nr:hypothetical protein [Bacteroidales bacterium]
MAKFLIEVPHGSDKRSCLQAIEIFLKTGSHFLTHADWGCLDGDHKAWIIADVDSKQDAMFIVPPVYRAQAKIVRLTTFTYNDLVHADEFHNGS